LNEKGDKLLVQGCDQRKDVFAFLSSDILKDLWAKVLLLKIQYDDGHVELSMEEQKKVSKIFSERDVVVVQSVRSSQKSAIYWTSKNIENMLAVNPVYEISSDETEKLHEFIENFLVESLGKGHLGENIFNLNVKSIYLSQKFLCLCY